MINFADKEFECKCGCGTNNVVPALKIKLDVARSISGVPYILNSACRCKKHNKEVGGTTYSAHLAGKAVDIRAEDSRPRFKIIQGLLRAGFKRIGIAKTFIHADLDESKDVEVCWLY